MAATTYERDFHAWTMEQAELLRAGRLAEIDTEHLIEELESMGAGERRQLAHRMKVQMAHLLQWRYQSHLRSRSWAATIEEQRLSIQDLIEENPSLTKALDDSMGKGYRLAKLLAVKETNLDETTFPENCPYSRTQILDEA